MREQLREGLIVNNRYQIEALLGEEGTESVYLCRDLEAGETRIRLKIASAGRFPLRTVSSLSKEFSLLVRLRHPNLVRTLDFGVLEASRELFVVEEWIEVQDVYSGTEGMDPEKVLRLIMKILKTLRYLHTRGIVHGNLNCLNIILCKSGEAHDIKLQDFGLIHHVPDASRRHGFESLAYLAPEVIMGAGVNESSDMYSLGVTIYQLLARRLPFEDEDAGFLMQKHLQGSVDLHPIERLRCGAGVSRLICSLLDKDPSKRPASSKVVMQLANELPSRDSGGTEMGDLENYLSASYFVGREKEMLLLQQSAACVRSTGRGWTIFITGEAGSGKTRCMEELRSWALLDGWRIIEGACGTHEKGSYGPFRQILATTKPPDGEAIFQFDGLPRVAESGTFDCSSEFAAGQFRDLLTRELVRRLTERPTLLLLHDFHLADEATSTVLDYLSSDIQSHPILMCVSLRSGERLKGVLGGLLESSIRQERGQVLNLDALTKENVQQLVAGMTGEHELKETLGTWMFGSIGGNPFFLEEMLKHLVEQRLLNRKLDRWSFVAQDLKNLEVPAGVGAVLQRRLKQLSPMAEELANWLALFHRPISKRVLSSTLSWDSTDFAESLQELSNSQMIRIEMSDPEENVAFCHSLIAEVIRGDLPQGLRHSMHRRIAEVLEREYGVEGHLQELAMHYMEGRADPVAVRYALALASQSRAEFAHENALNCFEYVFRNRGDLKSDEFCLAAIEASDTMLALGLSKESIRFLKPKIGKKKKIGELETKMLMQLAMSYHHFGSYKMQEVCCKKGLDYFRTQPFAHEANLTKSMLWAQLSFNAILQSKPKRGIVFLERALKSCPDPNKGVWAGRLQNVYASLHRVTCSLHEALGASQKAATILSNCEESYLTCSAYSTLGLVLMGLGRFSLALEKHKQAVLLSEKSRSVILRLQALGNMAECLCRMGLLNESINAAGQAMKYIIESNNPAMTFAFKTALAEIKLAASDYGGALKIINQLEKDVIGSSVLYASGHAYYLASMIGFVLGNFEAALEHIDKLSRLQTRDAPFYESELAEALKARICFERGMPKKAINNLYALDKKVTKKHWPYQMCIIKLYLAEVMIKSGLNGQAKSFALSALRLARGMQSTVLAGQSHFVLGLIYSRDYSESGWRPQLESAVEELQSACRVINPSFPNDTLWRAHAELCFVMRRLSKDGSLDHAEKAYGYLCQLEKRVPPEMLFAYGNSFDRNRIKSDLVRVIEEGRLQAEQMSVTGSKIYEHDKDRILLRISAAVNSISDLDELLEEILDQLIKAVNVERAIVLLKDELTGKLHMVKGRNDRQASLLKADLIEGNIFDAVFEHGQPIVSANVQSDPRVLKQDLIISGTLGRIFCAPLKISGRTLGVLYADHSAPAQGLSESAINLFAAFSNLAAIAIDNALAHQKLVREKSELEQYLHQARDEYKEIVGKSAVIEQLRDRIGLAAASPLDILITGESGTGKELVAEAIHRTGRRKLGKFIPVDCGSLSDSLAEAELFGYRKGAFTGATENRQGLLEAAQGGIIFLDEISNLPFRLQAKLLRVLQEREVRRIGETTPRRIDVQVMAAANRDLLEEMRKGRFRKDLYYRLKAMEIRVPHLRDHAEDIPLLIEWYLEKIAQSEGGKFKRYSKAANELLKTYHYPGNVRELKNIVSESYYSAKGQIIEADDLPPEVRQGAGYETGSESGIAGRLYVEIIEGRATFEELVREPFLNHQFGSSVVRGVIERALKDSGGKYRDAFTLLAIPDRQYSATMQFLKRKNCYLDFRPFRRIRKDSIS